MEAEGTAIRSANLVGTNDTDDDNNDDYPTDCRMQWILSL